MQRAACLHPRKLEDLRDQIHSERTMRTRQAREGRRKGKALAIQRSSLCARQHGLLLYVEGTEKRLDPGYLPCHTRCFGSAPSSLVYLLLQQGEAISEHLESEKRAREALPGLDIQLSSGLKSEKAESFGRMPC